MFDSCENLLYPPSILPATTLTINCYEKMFVNCEKMLYAPILPAENLRNSCYSYMFQSCKDIRRYEVNFTNWLSVQDNNKRCCTDWIAGGRNHSDVDFICPSALDTTQKDNNHVLQYWNIIKK